MRIVVHDYPGHPFPVQLSRYLADRGHDVWHIWSSDIEAPRGDLVLRQDDPKNFKLCPITQGKELPKYNLRARLGAERTYAKEFIRRVESLNVDIIISNPSPIIQGKIRHWCAKKNVKFISWLQDIYFLPIRDQLSKKYGVIGKMLSLALKNYELSVIKKSNHSIVISPNFKNFLINNGVPQHNISVIPNWAVLDQIDVLPKSNEWCQAHSLQSAFVFLYSGTLGLKHNPEILVKLANKFPNAKVVVISQGLGRRYLEDAKTQKGLNNLLLFDYQPFAHLSKVLASADVLVALLERDAAKFSVPSKVLTYMCAGRPILGAIPVRNEAAQEIRNSGAGFIEEPDEINAFLKSANTLYDDEKLRTSCGANSRKYAETTFDIDKIGHVFEQTFQGLLSAKPQRSYAARIFVLLSARLKSYTMFGSKKPLEKLDQQSSDTLPN